MPEGACWGILPFVAEARSPNLRLVRGGALPVDVYTRISALGDRDEHNLHSPTDQAAIAVRHLEGLGREVGAIFSDVRSGGTLRRRGLIAAIERIERGESGGIAVAFFDRLTRDTRGGRDLLARIAAAGGEVFAPDLPPDMQSAQGGLQIDMMLAFSTYLRRTTGERTEAARARAVGEGIAIAVPPPGYKLGPDRRLVPDPRTAPVVRRAFDMRLRGDGPSAIAKYLNEQGVRTARGNPMTVSSVTRLLHRRTYLGEIRAGDAVNPTAHEPIVDPATFDAVQALGKVEPEERDRPQRGRSFYLLSGLLHCGSCGQTMVGTHDAHGRRIYRCTGRLVGGCANRARVDAQLIEDEAVGLLLATEGELRGRPRVPRPQLDSLERQLAAAERRLAQALQPEVQDALGAEWAAFVKARREERDAASAAYGAARSVDPEQAELSTLRELWERGERLSDVDKRRILGARFPDIRVTRIGYGRRLVSLDPAFTPFVA